MVIVQVVSSSGAQSYLCDTQTCFPHFVVDLHDASKMDDAVAARWVHWLNYNLTRHTASVLRATE